MPNRYYVVNNQKEGNKNGSDYKRHNYHGCFKVKS